MGDSGVTGAPSLTSSDVAASPVGTYTITAALGSLAAQNYNFTFVNSTLSVTPATLTVTANPASRTYGALDPAYSDTITGFVLSQTLGDSGVTGAPSLTSNDGTASPVGTYTITAALGSLAAQNYNFTFVNSTLSVTPATLTVTANPASRTYGALDPAYSDTITGFVLSQTLGDSGVTGAPSLTSNDGTASPVGTYTITAALGSLAAQNYNFTFLNSTLSVTPATLTVTANPASRTYGALDPAYSDTITGFVLSQTLGDSGVTGAPSLTSNDTAGSPVGSYTITAALGTLATANYTFSFASGTLSVTPASLTVTANSASRTYGASDPGYTASYSGFVLSQTLGDSGVTGAPSLTSNDTAASPVANYTITAALGTLAAQNYNFTFVNSTLSVTPATLTVTANPASRTYGALDPAYSDTITGFVLSQTLGNSGVTGAPSLISNDTAGSPVGSYTITAALGTLATANYTFSFASGTLSVTPAALTVTANPASHTYGASDPGYTASYSGFVLSQTLGDSGVTGAPSLTSNDTAASPVGNYTITTALGTLAAQNYTFSFASGRLSVTPATLTVTANPASRSYGALDPAYSDTITGFVLSQTLGNSGVYGGPEPDQQRHGRQPGGQLHDHRGPGHVWPRQNYTFSFASGTLSVTPAALTVTANPASHTYGASDPAYTASYSGFVLSQTLGNSGVTGAPSLTSNDTAGSPVGSYTITAALGTLAAANYTFSFASGTLSVTPASLTVTANPASRTYGASDPGYTASYSGFLLSQTLGDSGVTGAPSLTSNDGTASPVGTYTITTALGSLAAQNYNFTFVNSTLSVTPATLTVTANPASRTYGALDPAYSDTITGFVLSQTLGDSGVTGAPSLTSNDGTASPVGTYTITAALGTLAAQNYNFTFVNSTLSVTPATLTVTANSASRVYGAADPTFTASYSGFVLGQTLGDSGVSGRPA